LIRVNLLPQDGSRRAAPESGQLWLVAVLVVVMLEGVALFLFHQTRVDELTDLQHQLRDFDEQVSSINTKVKDHAKLKEELGVLRAREDAIAKLQQLRKGPIGPLLEMSTVLTRDKGPTADPEVLKQRARDNPLDVYNPLWDGRRVWLTRYDESERTVLLEGLARDSGDVYEFAQRLKLSQYFDAVSLKKGVEAEGGKGEVELLSFVLEVKVKY